MVDLIKPSRQVLESLEHESFSDVDEPFVFRIDAGDNAFVSIDTTNKDKCENIDDIIPKFMSSDTPKIQQVPRDQWDDYHFEVL